jgi:hypothetical protein
MVARSIFGALVLLLVSTQAQANCRDDLKELKPRIDRIKTVDRARYSVAIKWWGWAMEVEPGSESECINFLARARKALFDPLPEVNNCYGPNAYLPQCENEGMVLGGAANGPAFGDGGGGTAAGPAGPVTAAGAAPFTPPGSVTSANDPR